MADKTERFAIINYLIRFFGFVFDYATYGILVVLNIGKKKTMPKIQNQILLQPAVQLAAKIRRGEVRILVLKMITVLTFSNFFYFLLPTMQNKYCFRLNF